MISCKIIFMIYVRWKIVKQPMCLFVTSPAYIARAHNELFPKLNDASFKRNYSLHLSRKRRHFAHLLRSNERVQQHLPSYSLPADPRPIPARRSVFPIRKLAEPTGNTCRTLEISFRSGIINRPRIKNNLTMNRLPARTGEQLVLRYLIYVVLS